MKIVYCALLAGMAHGGTLLFPGGVPLNGLEGSAVAGTVATFQDSDPNEAVSNILASIQWGDGTQSTGIVTSLGSGTYSVVGTHTYTEEGTNTLSIGVSNATSSLTISSAATIADAPLVNGSAINWTGMEGTAISGPMATFVDLNGFGLPSDFAATINWGDGTLSNGTVASNGSGQFTILGAHTYAEEGAYSFSINTVDDGGSTLVLGGTAIIADAPLTPGALVFSGATQGELFSGPVAHFVDLNADGLPSDFSATIDWGDGTFSLGTVVSNGSGNFTVSGAHTFQTTGVFGGAITIIDDGGSGTRTNASFDVVTPEPGSFGLLGFGLGLVGWRRLRKA